MDHILWWAIHSRRSIFLASGKGYCVDWDGGDGFGDFCVRFCRGPFSVCSLFWDSEHFWILLWGQTLSVSFCFRFGTLLVPFVGQTLSVRYFWIWDALLDSFVGLILSWAIPSRRSKLLSSGKRNSVDWDCGDGFRDLFVVFSG